MDMGPSASPSPPSLRRRASKPTISNHHDRGKPPSSKPAPKRVCQPLHTTPAPKANRQQPISTTHHPIRRSSSPPRHQNQRSATAKKPPPPALLCQPLSLATTPAHPHSPIQF